MHSCKESWLSPLSILLDIDGGLFSDLSYFLLNSTFCYTSFPKASLIYFTFPLVKSLLDLSILFSFFLDDEFYKFNIFPFRNVKVLKFKDFDFVCHFILFWFNIIDLDLFEFILYFDSWINPTFYVN